MLLGVDKQKTKRARLSDEGLLNPESEKCCVHGDIEVSWKGARENCSYECETECVSTVLGFNAQHHTTLVITQNAHVSDADDTMFLTSLRGVQSFHLPAEGLY